jgi:hypothetical protein
MALSREQIAALKEERGIDQTALAAYEESLPPEGQSPAGVADLTVDPNDPASRINVFSSALNTAIDEARQQRKDSVLDFAGGVIPPGALPASSFAGVLSAFEGNAAPIEDSLLDGALGFAMQEEERKAKTKSEISDLALKVGINGGSQDTVNAILALMESGDIAAAVKIAATGLAKKGVTGDDASGALLDKEGNPIWEISNKSLWEAGKQGPIFEASKFGDEFRNSKIVSTQELQDEMNRLMGNKQLKIHGLLKNDTNRRKFMDDWVEYQEFVAGGPVDPEEFLQLWEKAQGLSLTKKPEAKEGEEDDEEKELWEYHTD